MTSVSYLERYVIKLVGEMSERHGGQSSLAKALGLNDVMVSRAVTGVSIQVKLTDAIGLVFDGVRGRYVRVREPAYVTGVDALAALRAELADVRLALRAARARITCLIDEVDRLKSKLAGNDQVAA